MPSLPVGGLESAACGATCDAAPSNALSSDGALPRGATCGADAAFLDGALPDGAAGRGRIWRGPAAREALAGVAALVLLLLWDASGLDLPLVRLFGGPAGFAWRHELLTATVLHAGGRWCSAALLGLTLLAAARPFGPWRGLGRAERLWWVAVTASCLLAVPALKRHSLTSCPWDLQEFGGRAHYVSHWRTMADGGPGHCFPSGHASGAFSFLAIAVVLRARRPRLARAWAFGLVALGALFGLAQTMRGAHYASHTLYTAWLCATLTLGSHRAFGLARRPHPHRAGDAPEDGHFGLARVRTASAAPRRPAAGGSG